MNVNIWDVQQDLIKLVRASLGGKTVDLARLADRAVPLADLAAEGGSTRWRLRTRT
jgi:3-phenylpropionate/trans-cinnamate dioxygenase ferredoxin reductase subunit